MGDPYCEPGGGCPHCNPKPTAPPDDLEARPAIDLETAERLRIEAGELRAEYRKRVKRMQGYACECALHPNDLRVSKAEEEANVLRARLATERARTLAEVVAMLRHNADLAQQNGWPPLAYKQLRQFADAIEDGSWAKEKP